MIRFEIDNQYFPTLFPTLVFKTFLIRLRWETFNKKKKDEKANSPFIDQLASAGIRNICAHRFSIVITRVTRAKIKKSTSFFFLIIFKFFFSNFLCNFEAVLNVTVT